MSTWTPAPNTPGFIPGIPVYPSDTVCKALIYGLEQPVQPRRGMVRRTLGQPGVRTGFWPIGLVMLIVALASLVLAWFGNDVLNWMFYWIFAGSAFLLHLLFFGWVWYARHQVTRFPDGISAPGQVSVRSLRRAALAGDDNFAPPVTIYPEMPTTPQLETAATPFRVTPPESRLLREQQILYGIMLIFSLFIAAMWVALFIVDRTILAPASLPWQFALYFLIPVMQVWRFVAGTQQVRAVQVEVREDGLHWRKHSLPWSEVRGWYVLAMSPEHLSNPRPNIIYAVVGQHTSLTWLTNPPYVRTGEPGQQLAQLVQSRVRLPLRDLTPGALHLSYEITGQFSRRRPLLLAASDRHLGGLSLPPMPVVALALALSVIVLLSGIITPATQQWYFGGQLAQLEHARATVRDPLTANTLQWAPMSPDAAQSFAFTQNGYQYLSTTCCNSGSLIAQPLTDGLVEVTVRQQVNFDLNEAGILFRVNRDSNTALAFVVTPNGEWHLERRPIHGVGNAADYRTLRYEGVFGGISAIHQGSGATNRLAVLMRGSSYSFFVNGRYLGGYVATDLPQSGQVGVYVGLAHGPVTFSDLLISPA